MTTPEQEKAIKEFMAGILNSGETTSLSEVQKMVNEKFQLRMTYMEIRILAAELEDVDWTKGDPNQPKPKAEEAPAAEGGDDNAAAAPAEGVPAAAGDTVVELSKIARPGMLLSGSVRFASGSTADWYIDQTGRLGVENLVGEKPTQQDIEEFQIKLEEVARKAMGR